MNPLPNPGSENNRCPSSAVGAGVVFLTLAYLETFFGSDGFATVVEEVLAAAVDAFPVLLLLADVSAAETFDTLASSSDPPAPGGP